MIVLFRYLCWIMYLKDYFDKKNCIPLTLSTYIPRFHLQCYYVYLQFFFIYFYKSIYKKGSGWDWHRIEKDEALRRRPYTQQGAKTVAYDDDDDFIILQTFTSSDNNRRINVPFRLIRIYESRKAFKHQTLSLTIFPNILLRSAKSLALLSVRRLVFFLHHFPESIKLK